VAKFILRESQHLAALEVIDDALVLSVLRFADELVDESQLTFPAAKDIRKAELDMAKALVNGLAAKWDPTKYTNDYRANLLRIIQGKLKGTEVALQSPEEPRQAEVIDLMERLRRSLAQAEGGAKQRSRHAASSAKPRPKARTQKRVKKPRAA